MLYLLSIQSLENTEFEFRNTVPKLEEAFKKAHNYLANQISIFGQLLRPCLKKS